MKKVKVYFGFRYEAENIIDADSDWDKNLEKLNIDAQTKLKEGLDFLCLDDDTGKSVLSDWMMAVEEVNE